MFSRTERCISSASARSAATKTTPCRIASAGWPKLTGLPSRSMEPPAGRSAPDRMSNSSSWPCPSRATTPRTSPAWRSKVASRSRRPPLSSLALIRGVCSERLAVAAVDAAAWPSPAAASPSMSSTIFDSEPAVTSTTPTVSPFRSTVARSQTAAISMRRWEMKMTDRSGPCCFTDWSTRSERFAGRAAVISSRSRTSGSMASARARSMIRSDASGRRHATLDRFRSPRPSSLQPVPEGLDRGRGQAQVVANVEVRDDRRLLVDGDEAVAPRVGRRMGDALLAAHDDAPGVGHDRTGQDLDERALAGAVGAHERVDLARPDGERGALERDDSAIRLGDVGRLEQQVGGRDGHRSFRSFGDGRWSGQAGSTARWHEVTRRPCRRPGRRSGRSRSSPGSPG